MDGDDFYECGHTFTGQPECSLCEAEWGNLLLEWVRILDEYQEECKVSER